MMFWLILVGGILLIVAWLIRRQQLINLAKKLSGIEIKKFELPDFSILESWTILAIGIIILVYIFSMVMQSIPSQQFNTTTPYNNSIQQPNISYMVYVLIGISIFLTLMIWRHWRYDSL